MKQQFDLQNHIEQGVEKIVADTIKATLKNPKEPWYGVDFETTLPDLLKME